MFQEFAMKSMRIFGEVEASDIENEVRAIDKLCKPDGHQNIIVILDHGWLSFDLYFIDMELCDLSLQQYIYCPRTTPKDWNAPKALSFLAKECSRFHVIANVWAILYQITEGLAYIHKQDLVHRDMKPGNGESIYDRAQLNIAVLYSFSKKLWKIVDFGISATAATKQVVTSQYRRGTPSYRAPELINEDEPGRYTNK